jgi:hypothetical protein
MASGTASRRAGEDTTGKILGGVTPFSSLSRSRYEELLRKELTMKFTVTTIAALALVTGAASVSAFSERNGDLHVTKECSQNNGKPGDFCTITSSNLAAIPLGTKVYYDQAYGIPAGFLDSNVLLYVGTGNWAVGRCTLDPGTGHGLCTFSDGTGPLAGFKARVDVSPTGGVNYAWDGTYSFSPPEHDR